jgi:hypothetical protein
MAITAVVTLNPAGPVPIATEIQAKVVISNSGASEVFISNAVPKIFPTSQASDGPSFAQNAGPIAIPALSPVSPSGSLTLTFPIVFNSGTGLSTNTVGCLIYGADGSLTSATPATISIVGNNQYA